MELSLELELESSYEELRGRIFKIAYSHKYTRQEAEDLFHDILLVIWEGQVVREDWPQLITREFGKNRSKRYRTYKRHTRLNEEYYP